MSEESLLSKRFLKKIGILEIVILILMFLVQIQINNLHGGIDSIGSALVNAFLYRAILFIGSVIVFISLLKRIINYKKNKQEKGKWIIDIFICIFMSIGFDFMNIEIGSIIYDFVFSGEYTISIMDFMSEYTEITLITLGSYAIGIVLMYKRFYNNIINGNEN